MRRSPKSFVAAGFLAATALAGCATGPDMHLTDRNGDNYGPGVGANVIVGDGNMPVAHPSGWVAKPQEVRYRIKNSAGRVVADYVHTFVYASARRNESVRPLGYCWAETPAAGTPAFNRRTGTNDGVMLFNGMEIVPVVCGPGDPYNYAQNSYSPYGDPVVDQRTGRFIGLYNRPAPPRQ